MTEDLSLHTYLDAELIAVQAKISSRKKLLQEISELLVKPLRDPDNEEDKPVRAKDIYHALLEREKLGNTGIGNGVALPHSRFEHADRALIAIITLEEAIDYDSLDRQPVDVAVGLLVPKDATQDHLNILAKIAGFLSEDGNKLALASCRSAEQVINLIGNKSVSG